MRWSKTLIPTMRQTPAEAVVPSHQWMLRAGYIQQVASGAYTYLPLGWRVLRKVTEIIRQEMDRAGAAEVFMPTLQPLDWWEQTGRRAAYGENLFVVTDRHGREQALGPTHEEVVTMLVKNAINSYRQLPLILYQIQTKFRDEFRPRFGVLRSREFQMKDAYSFHLDMQTLDEAYETMRVAYRNIFARCGLTCVEVEAEAGPIGGNASHEFMIPSPTGEDVILASDKGNYAANVEKCETGTRAHDLSGSPTGDLSVVNTPDCSSIQDLCANWKKFDGGKLKPQNCLKTLVFSGPTKSTVPGMPEYKWVLVVVRGDHEINEAKVRALCGKNVTVAIESEARDAGFEIGFVGPHIADTRSDTWIVIDPDAAQPNFWVTGANTPNQHVRHFNWQRDLFKGREGTLQAPFGHTVADIRNAAEGDPSPKNDGGILQASKGIEVGHVFKLGRKYSEALNLNVLDENQSEQSLIMGCYGIGVNRIVAAAIESTTGHDDGGILWPIAIAPYQVVLTPVKYEGRMKDVADQLYQTLTAAGVEVLLDDRDERPGVKFKDADLIGIPLRITVGDKGLDKGVVEFKRRTADQAEDVSPDAILDRVKSFLANPV